MRKYVTLRIFPHAIFKIPKYAEKYAIRDICKICDIRCDHTNHYKPASLYDGHFHVYQG